MRVALYARVSSEKQAENDLSIAAQLKALREHAQKNNWIVCKEFIDEAESARTADRPAFQEMISYSKKKEKLFEAILIWKFSRFARNREDAIIYKSLLRKHGVSVISINEQVDDTPSGKLLEGIIEVMDEFYSSNLAQDTIRGLKENASRGFQNGAAPLGYKIKNVMDGNVQRSKLEPDEGFAPLVKRIFQMSMDNIGIKEIAKAFNSEGLKTNKGKPWGSTTIAYILKNEAYTGALLWNKTSKYRRNQPHEIIRVENNHPAIIDRQTFLDVQKLINARSPKIMHPRRVASDYLLSGLIYCGKCGLKLVGSSAKSGKFFYYACQNHLKRGKDVCRLRVINKEVIERAVIDTLKNNVLTEENIMGLIDLVLDELNQSRETVREELKTLDTQLETLREKLGRLYAAIETGKINIADLAPRIKDLKNQMDILEIKKLEALEKASSPKTLPFDPAKIRLFVEDLCALLRKGTLVERKGFLRTFIKRIEVHPPEVIVEYVLPLKTPKAEHLIREVLPLEQCGCPVWTRTTTPRSRVWCPTIRRQGNGYQ